MAETINGFELIEPLQNRDAGFSRWGFARREGRVFFLKEFLKPVFPSDPSIGEKQMRARRDRCRQYEERMAAVYRAVNEASDGNLVRIEAFFRSGSHYYVAMERVLSAGFSMEDIARLPAEDKKTLCRIVAHSIYSLHQKGVIHADIKDTNILIKRTALGLTAKVIDYDGSFLADAPPESGDDLAGDQVYLSPEACRFMCGEEVPLTTRMDVFSLGILFHQYLTGEAPGFDTSAYYYLHEAVLDGREAVVSGQIEEPLRRMLGQMLQGDPDRRWDMGAVCEALLPASLEKERTIIPPHAGFSIAGSL